MSADADGEKGPVLLIATLSAFLTPFMGSAVNIALPSIGEDFHLEALLLSWVATAYLLAAAIFLVPFGRAADIHGRKRVFLYGMTVFTVFSLLCGVSTSGWLLVGMRFAQGLGAAMIFGTGVALLTSVFPPGERGRALGINVAAVYVGLSVGPFVGGVLTEQLGWRSVFLMNVPLGLLIIGVTLWRLRGEWAEARGERFDTVGTVIYSLTITSVMLGFSLLPRVLGGALLGAGMLGLLWFVRWESTVDSPVLRMDLFRRNRVFAYSNLAALINYSATFAVAFLLSLYLQLVKDLDAHVAGMVLLVQPIVQAFFSPLAGWLSDRVEPRVVASSGMAVIFVGLVLFVLIIDGTELVYIFGGLYVLGLGFALFSSPNTNAVMSSVDRSFYGVASGTVATMRVVGQVLSMGVAMLLFAVFIGDHEITAEYHGAFVDSVRVAFVIFAALCFLGIFASLARGQLRREENGS